MIDDQGHLVISGNDCVICPKKENEHFLLGCEGYETFSNDGKLIMIRPAWIDISKKLPEENEPVLVSTDSEIRISKYTYWPNGTIYWHNVPTLYSNKITHWMTLPSLPGQ